MVGWHKLWAVATYDLCQFIIYSRLGTDWSSLAAGWQNVIACTLEENVTTNCSHVVCSESEMYGGLVYV